MPKISGEPIGSGIQSSALALQILEQVVANKAIGVTALAQLMNTPKSRMHRHLQTLVEQGFVAQLQGSELYGVGNRLIVLARKVVEGSDLFALAQPLMEKLRDSLGYTVALSEPDAGGARVLGSIRGNSVIEISIRTGSLLEYNQSAQGKLVAAFAGPEHRERALASRYEATTSRTLVDRADLEAEFAQVRAQGWAKSAGEFAQGINALAAPIFDGPGRLCATLGVIGAIRFTGDRPLATDIREIVATAGDISNVLGYPASQQP